MLIFQQKLQSRQRQHQVLWKNLRKVNLQNCSAKMIGWMEYVRSPSFISTSQLAHSSMKKLCWTAKRVNRFPINGSTIDSQSSVIRFWSSKIWLMTNRWPGITTTPDSSTIQKSSVTRPLKALNGIFLSALTTQWVLLLSGRWWVSQVSHILLR